MASIKFLLQSKGESCNIYMRLSIDRKHVFKRKTNYLIDSSDWKTEIQKDKNSKKIPQTGIPKQSNETLKNLKTDLEKLKNDIEIRLNNATAKGIEITGYWLQDQINDIQNKPKENEPDRLINHFQHYIDNLPTNRTGTKKKPVTPSTITKYKSIKNKLIAFEKHYRKKVFVKDVNLKFRSELIEYFREIEKLSNNTIGRYITFIKTVCNDSKIYGIETHPQLNAFKGYSDEASKVFLSFNELEKIESKKFVRTALDNAKDWLIIGCYIGQRVSDLLILTKDNIINKNGLELISLTQQKTNKNIIIPMPPKVKEILNKREGEFPTKISAAKFNKHIKDVAKLAEINELTEGAKLEKLDDKTYRKVYGTFEKWELITSHVMRRSFATNYYGEMPTALIISITGHSTEAQYLEYVGKPPIDNAQLIAEYWNTLYLKQQNKKLPLRKVI
jgi:integrase